MPRLPARANRASVLSRRVPPVLDRAEPPTHPHHASRERRIRGPHLHKVDPPRVGVSVCGVARVRQLTCEVVHNEVSHLPSGLGRGRTCPYSCPMTEQQEDPRVSALEADLITDLRVLGILFGPTSSEHGVWARSCMESESADHYITAWKEGRRRHWRAVERATKRLQALTGEGPVEWNSRLSRLEFVSEVQLADFRPTSHLASL
jgi:hypothetical protein